MWLSGGVESTKDVQRGEAKRKEHWPQGEICTTHMRMKSRKGEKKRRRKRTKSRGFQRERKEALMDKSLP